MVNPLVFEYPCQLGLELGRGVLGVISPLLVADLAAAFLLLVGAISLISW